MRPFILAASLLGACFLAGCGPTGPAGTVSPQLDSGVTANNGGGVRTLGGAPTGAVSTTRVGPAP